MVRPWESQEPSHHESNTFSTHKSGEEYASSSQCLPGIDERTHVNDIVVETTYLLPVQHSRCTRLWTPNLYTSRMKNQYEH